MTEARPGWIRVPVGEDAARWSTRGRCRLVLFVVHNVTSATRLLDVLPLFRDDLSVQLLATCTGSSPFQDGVPELLARVDVPVLPWEQAVRTPVALAISASLGGRLADVPGKLIILSHGAGYNKKLRHRGTQGDTGGHRGTQGDTGGAVFGLSREDLLAGGAPIADAMVLSHPEQLARLRAACPEAAPTAVLAGDPCYDRILAALPRRDRFRRALGVAPGQRLVLLNSTWNPESLFGDGGPDDVLPHLLPRLTAELPADEYRVAAVLHPNIWHGHGPGQIRTWLDRARRAGLTLVDPLHAWRQALIAADAVIGDFGSVTYYAAALGTPVLLGAAGPDVLGADSPVAAFARAAPRLDPYAPLPPQLDALLAHHGADAEGDTVGRSPADPARLVSSAPGQSAALLRRTFYRLIGTPEPPERALLDPLPLPPYQPAVRTAVLRVLTRLPGGGEIAVTRYADPRYEPPGDGAAHTAVHEDTLDPDMLAQADVILQYATADDPRLGPPGEWAARTLERWRSCALAAYVTGPGSCTARTRDGRLVLLSGSARDTDPAAYASALHAWLAGGKALQELCALGMTVRTGHTVRPVAVSLLP